MKADNFTSLGISPFFLERLKERNIKSPTEIQKKVIPRLLQGESLAFSSATGTGKTFAYLLPVLERLISLLRKDGTEGDPPETRHRERQLTSGQASFPSGSAGSVLRGKPLVLITAPTFELCSQIYGEVNFLLGAMPFPVHSALLIGSASPGRQIEALKKDRPEIIVGNPGRIIALARTGKLQYRNIRFLVLDEGDRQVQDELYKETEEMISLLKSPFQGITCSATLPPRSRKRLCPLLGIPLSPGSSVDDSANDILKENVEHWAFFCQEREKINLLRSLLAVLKEKKSVKALIFTGKGSQVEKISSRLKHHKLPAAGLWGGMDKGSRKQALDSFRSGKIRFLATSDLAARGLDIAGVSHVISLDLGEDKNIYIHRAGRTARAGNNGFMISIGTEAEMYRLKALEKKLGITVYPKILYGGRILAPDE